MRNFFNYLRLPVFSGNDSIRYALSNVPHDEQDIHYVLSDNTRLAQYKRTHLQCTAMAALLDVPSVSDDLIDKQQWLQRLSDFDANQDDLV